MFYTAVTRLSLGFEYRHNENKRIHIYFSQRGHPRAYDGNTTTHSLSALVGMSSFLIHTYSVSTRVSSIFKFVSRRVRRCGGVGQSVKTHLKVNKLQHTFKLLSLDTSDSPV